MAFTFNLVNDMMQDKVISPIDLKSSLAGNSTRLEDFFGGEDIKVKFRETIDFLRNPKKYE